MDSWGSSTQQFGKKNLNEQSISTHIYQIWKGYCDYNSVDELEDDEIEQIATLMGHTKTFIEIVTSIFQNVSDITFVILKRAVVFITHKHSSNLW